MSHYDTVLSKVSSADFVVTPQDPNGAPIEFQHKMIKSATTGATYNFGNYWHPNHNEDNTKNFNNHQVKLLDVQCKTAINPSFSTGQYNDFDIPYYLTNGLLQRYYISITVSNPTSSAAVLFNAGFWFYKLQILSNGSNSISNDIILRDYNWLELCLNQTPLTKNNMCVNIGMNPANYQSNCTIPANSSETFIVPIFATQMNDMYYIRDAISANTITWRIFYSPNIHQTTAVLTSSLVVTNMFLRLQFIEVSNNTYNYLLNQPYLDYKIILRNVVFTQTISSASANVKQTYTIQTCQGAALGMICYAKNTGFDTSNPPTYETTYPFIFELVDNNNKSMQNNLVFNSPQEITQFSTLTSHHDFFNNFGNVYLLSWTPDFLSAIKYNRFSGEPFYLPTPSFKINVTFTSTVTNVTLYCLFYVCGIARIDCKQGKYCEFSS